MDENERKGIWSFLRLRREQKEQREPLKVTNRMRWRSFWKHFGVAVGILVVWGFLFTIAVEYIRPGSTKYYFTGSWLLASAESVGGWFSVYLGVRLYGLIPSFLGYIHKGNPLSGFSDLIWWVENINLAQMLFAAFCALVFTWIFAFLTRKAIRLSKKGILWFLLFIICNTLAGFSVRFIGDWRSGTTPLHKAANTDNFSDIKRFVKSGYNVNAISITGGKIGYTALDWTVIRKNKEAVVYLLEHGAIPSPTDPRCWGSVYHAINSGTDTEILRILLDHGADPNRGWEIGSPICIAALNGTIEQVRLLVEHGADVNDNKHGLTPLQRAVQSEKYDIARYLIDRGADVKTLTNSANVNFYINKPEQKAFLNELGIDPNAVPAIENTESASRVNDATTVLQPSTP